MLLYASAEHQAMLTAVQMRVYFLNVFNFFPKEKRPSSFPSRDGSYKVERVGDFFLKIVETDLLTQSHFS